MQTATGPGTVQSVELLHFKGLNNVQHEDGVKMHAIKTSFYLRTNKKLVRKCAFNIHSAPSTQ